MNDSRRAYLEELEELELLFTGAGEPSKEAMDVIVSARRRATSAIEAGGGTPDATRSGLVIFAASLLNGLWLERDWQSDDVKVLLAAIAEQSGQPLEYVAMAVALRALNDPSVLELSPAVAIEAQVGMLFTFAPLRAVSLWTPGPEGRARMVIHRGPGTPSRRVRELAAHVLAGQEPRPGVLQAVPVLRWQQPDGALVARPAPAARQQSLACMQEAARMLGPLFERQALLEQNAVRERQLVAASERRLTRLGFDLHDGPIQDVAALASDLRLFREQLSSVISDGPDRDLLLGRVADLEAQVVALDANVRDLSHSLDVPQLARRPFRDALGREVDAFRRRAEIELQVDLSGNFDVLTPSQRIAVLRIVQEALTNVREHSGATRARVSIAVRPGHLRARIEDNGRGFHVKTALARAAERGRLGLAGMSERTQLLGGRIDIRSAPGGPSVISLVLPRLEPGLLEGRRDAAGDSAQPLAAG